MEAAFGRPGHVLISALQFVYPFIAMVSYNVIAGDTLTKLVVAVSGPDPELLASGLASRPFLVLLATLLLTLPLSMFRDVNRLAKVIIKIFTTVFSSSQDLIMDEL
jgi:sodium-coupled neutral amino acid transporter 11